MLCIVTGCNQLQDALNIRVSPILALHLLGCLCEEVLELEYTSSRSTGCCFIILFSASHTSAPHVCPASGRTGRPIVKRGVATIDTP
jgi:hypothetical protein